MAYSNCQTIPGFTAEYSLGVGNNYKHKTEAFVMNLVAPTFRGPLCYVQVCDEYGNCSCPDEND